MVLEDQIICPQIIKLIRGGSQSSRVLWDLEEAYPIILSSLLYSIHRVILMLLGLEALGAKPDLVIITEQQLRFQVFLTVGIFWDLLL